MVRRQQTAASIIEADLHKARDTYHLKFLLTVALVILQWRDKLYGGHGDCEYDSSEDVFYFA